VLGWTSFHGHHAEGEAEQRELMAKATARGVYEDFAMSAGSLSWQLALAGRLNEATTLAEAADDAVSGHDWYRFGALARLATINARIWTGSSVPDHPVAPSDHTGQAPLLLLERFATAMTKAQRNAAEGRQPFDDDFRTAADELMESRLVLWMGLMATPLVARDLPAWLRSPFTQVAGTTDPCFLQPLAAMVNAWADDDEAPLAAAAQDLERAGILPLAALAHAQRVRLTRASMPLQAFHSEVAARRCLSRVDGLHPKWQPPVTQVLTERQHQIAALATGQTSQEVAERLFVSKRTVDNHLHRIFTKLGIDGRDELD